MFTIVFNEGQANEFTIEVNWFEEVLQFSKPEDESSYFSLMLYCIDFPNNIYSMQELCAPLFNNNYDLETIDCYSDNTLSEKLMHCYKYHTVSSCSTTVGDHSLMQVSANANIKLDNEDFNKLGVIVFKQTQ